MKFADLPPATIRPTAEEPFSTLQMPRVGSRQLPFRTISAAKIFPKEWTAAREPIDESRGNPLYAKFKDAGFDPLNPSEKFAAPFGASPLSDSISIFPVPLLVSRQELESIRKGTAQQIKALSKWFADLVIGKDPEAEISNKVVPAQVVHTIMATTELQSLERLRRFWIGRTEADITFLGAPDLIRAPDGKRYTLEFNVGSLGGLADSPAIHEFYRRALPCNVASELSKSFLLTTNDLAVMVNAWATTGPRRNAKLLGPTPIPITSLKRLKTAAVATSGDSKPVKFSFDLESHRLATYLNELGLPKVNDLRTVNGATIHDPVALFCPNASIPLKLFFSGAVKTLNAPGTDDVLGNKLLLPYLDDLIRHYCSEEPLLPCIPSRIVALRGRTTKSDFSFEIYPFDQDAPRLIVLPKDRIVLKLQDGAQGTEVHLFTPETYHELQDCFTLAGIDVEQELTKLRHKPEIYSAQPFIEISRLRDHLVDTRPMAIALGGGDSYVGESLWGRAIKPASKGGSGLIGDIGDSLKLNVSGNAQELVVISER